MTRRRWWLLLLIGASLALYAGTRSGDVARVADSMTYGNFDLPPADGQAGVMYLAPGVEDYAVSVQYRFDSGVRWHPLVALGILFAVMAVWRLVRNPDGRAGPARGLVQWLGFVGTRLGVLRVAGLVPVPRCAAGVLPLLNCQACEMANGACPVGAAQAFLRHGDVPLFVVGSVSVFGLAAGRRFCGWLCPFGMIEDLITRYARLRLKVPQALEWGRFVTLGLLVVVPLVAGLFEVFRVFPLCATLCPSGLFMGLAPYYLTHGLPALQEVLAAPAAHLAGVAWMVVHGLALVLYLGLALNIGGRVFCRFLCPLGAALGLFNRVALVRIETNGSCSACHDCQVACPAGLDPADDGFLAHTGCIRCGRCVSQCSHNTRRWVVGDRPLERPNHADA